MRKNGNIMALICKSERKAWSNKKYWVKTLLLLLHMCTSCHAIRFLDAKKKEEEVIAVNAAAIAAADTSTNARAEGFFKSLFIGS